ncbi:DUF1851 domain-containing protein [Rhizobium sp.]
MSNVMDYLIDQDGKDWTDLLSDWLPLFPPGFTVWLVNRLGDVIALFDDGSVHFLDVGAGSLTRIADDRTDFATRLEQDDNTEMWLAISLVDDCVRAGMTLGENQCFGFRIPPILGGEYAVENLEPTDLSVHYSLLGQIWQQTRDLPEGTTVNISIGD